MKKKSIGVGIGVSSLMMIFTVLGLTIFSSLSLLQANLAYENSLKYKNSVVDYINGDSEAMKLKSKLERKETLKERERNNFQVTYKEYIHYQVKINDKDYLDVILDYDYNVIRWTVINYFNGFYGSRGFDF